MKLTLTELRKMRNRRDASSNATGRNVASARLKLALFRFAVTLVVFLTPEISQPLHAQNVRLHTRLQQWTSRDGLPATVFSITQTQDGALWVGTLNGLARFDGIEFSVFTPQNLPQLGSIAVRNIAAGTDSQLYLGTDGGLTILDHGQARRVQGPAESGSSISMVLPLGSDEAWYGTTLGALCHYVHGSVERVGAGVLPGEPVFGLAMAPDRTLWIATGGGLFLLSHGRIHRYEPAIPLPVLPFYDLAFARDGSLFVASESGLFQIQGSHWKLFTKKDGLPSDSLNILTMDTNGSLWIGTSAGLAEFRNGTIRPLSSVKCSVNSMFADREESLWIGCMDARGLTRITFPQVRFLSAPGGPEARPIVSLAEDRDGGVWMASQGGLFRRKSESSTQATQQRGLPSDQINSISLSDKGTVSIATNFGLASLDRGHLTQIRTKRKGLSDMFFKALLDRQGTLWATTLAGLERRHSNQQSLQSVPGFVGSIMSLVESRDGAVWISTYTLGLHRFVGDYETKFDVKCLGSNRVFDSAQDASGVTWVWTAGGLSRIRNDNCASLGEANGFPPNLEGNLLLDQQGHLWLITQKGIAVVDLEEANAVLDHGGSLQSTRYLGADDGFGEALSDSQSFSPVLMHPSGDIWIATLDGIAVISPAILQRRPAQMAPQVTSLVTDVGVRDLGSTVRVKPGDRHLQFTYSAPYLRNVRSREYRYRLVGFDPDWRTGTKTRDAVYTSLPAGEYRFEVSSRLPFETWSKTSDPINLRVLPHFYQTWWWYTLIALLLLSVLGLSYWLRSRALQKSYTKMLTVRLQERSRLARELHDTLSRGMIAIHVKIQLASALLHSEPDSALGHLESAVGVIRQSASETRRSIAALRFDAQETTSLGDAIDKAVSSFKENSSIPLETNIADDLPQVSEEVSHEIARIVEEALANVRLHSKADRASLSVCKSERSLQIDVHDNGKGFDSRPQDTERLNHFGLTGMKERAQRIHGNLEIISTPGEGTRMVLKYPLST